MYQAMHAMQSQLDKNSADIKGAIEHMEAANKEVCDRVTKIEASTDAKLKELAKDLQAWAEAKIETCTDQDGYPSRWPVQVAGETR